MWSSNLPSVLCLGAGGLLALACIILARFFFALLRITTFQEFLTLLQGLVELFVQASDGFVYVFDVFFQLLGAAI